MASKILPTKRTVVPTFVPMIGFNEELMVRSCPETHLVDVIQAFSLVLGAQTAKKIVNDMLTRIDSKRGPGPVDLSPFSRCRWKGNAGRESIIAPLTVVVQMLMMHPSTKTMAARVECVTRNAALVAELKQTSTEKDAYSVRCNELEAELHKQQLEVAELERAARKRLVEEGRVDALKAELEAVQLRVGALREAEVAAEDDMCMKQFDVLCRRVGIPCATRQQLAALYLGQYSEVRDQFAGKVTVSRSQMIEWLRDNETGRRFWDAYSSRCGFQHGAFNTDMYEIEHIQNSAWGGADHYLNYMVLPSSLNKSIEFRTGPCHLKMILMGRHMFSFVQSFAVWNTTTKNTIPRDSFLVSQPDTVNVSSLLGGLQQTKLCFKRQRVD